MSLNLSELFRDAVQIGKEELGNAAREAVASLRNRLTDRYMQTPAGQATVAEFKKREIMKYVPLIVVLALIAGLLIWRGKH